MTIGRLQLITPELLDGFLQAVEPALMRRATAMLASGGVTLEQVEPASAVVVVVDGTAVRRVTALLIAGRVTTLCDCAHRDDGPCVHRVAAVRALYTHMTSNPPQPWEILFSLSDRPRSTTATPTAAVVCFFLVPSHPLGVGDAGWAVIPASVTSRAGRADWTGADVRPLRAPPTPAGYPNSPLSVLQAAAMLCEQSLSLAQPGQRAWLYAGALALLVDQTVYVARDGLSFGHPVHVYGEPGELQLSCDEDGADILLQSIVYSAQRSIVVDQANRTLLPFSPHWLWTGATLVCIGERTTLVDHLLQTPALRVRAEDRERFDQRLLELAQRVPLCGSAVRWDEVHDEPVGNITVAEHDAGVVVRLAFVYANYELPFDQHYPAEAVLHGSEELHLVRVTRLVDSERDCVALLEQQGLRMSEDGSFRLRKTIPVRDFLMRVVGVLASHGLQIRGEDALTSVQMRTDIPELAVTVQSHIDWFDVSAVVNFGDLSVDVAVVRRAVLRRERYILLPDGTIGFVPNELAHRLAPLLAMGTESDGRLRFAAAQTAIVDQLVQEAQRAQVDATFEERREQLRLFEHIEDQPLPEGFRGTLRSYQKAGYDWLHFLNRYGFGGCLADDMGVGKTIQTLAFILSLRERTPGARAILIVLPRSLVYNWLREAATFAPSLTLLTHIDQGRAKDATPFDSYDVVLTTYGTMLRDIEFLAGYRFQYVILDESQAIKNPAAETARAVRRLQGDRRLSLTGTPIENNAVELWSQFAFLNPGLLGTAEAFRDTFAREGEGREGALKLLRRLTFPFILRRTKDQVAPDLPSRTEHILMSDMEPEQRRLYTTQRDHYRALLLGMIDSAGPQQARVKMLEGLLRLRQICNHPRLIDPSSAGSSGKFEALLATLESLKAAGHRVLVFSQFVQMLTLVRTALDERGIAYAYLDGRTRDRQSIIDAFQNDTRYPFFLISLRAGGVGLNLTAADYVIHIDPWWNPAVEMQATDRTHRIGQTRPVMVYKMVVRDSVEEKILQLQERKRELVSQLITPERGGIKTLTRADVELLFT